MLELSLSIILQSECHRQRESHEDASNYCAVTPSAAIHLTHNSIVQFAIVSSYSATRFYPPPITESKF